MLDFASSPTFASALSYSILGAAIKASAARASVKSSALLFP